MKKTNAKTANPDTTRAVVIRSEDGQVCFRLRPTPSGLLVQRDRRRRESRARLVQSVVFSSIDGFARWCESDSVRFDYPIILSTVKREGDALLQSLGTGSDGEPDHGRS